MNANMETTQNWAPDNGVSLPYDPAYAGLAGLETEAYEESGVILTDPVKHFIQNPPFIQHMLDTIDKVDQYAWNRGTMGLKTGFKGLDEAFRGLNTGLILFAGGSNAGKSAMLLQLAWAVANQNQYIDEDHPKMAFCLYFSLDDSNNELMPRIVAIDQHIEINAALFPKNCKGQPALLDKREKGWERMRDNVRFLAMHDAENGSSIERIEQTIRNYEQALEQMAPGQYRLVIFIDNFHDISVEASGYSEENARFDFISDKLNKIAIDFDCPILCSAEFRKINVNKRPQLDDIKSTGKITYEAKGIVLCYNEVGIKSDSANIYWEVADKYVPDLIHKMPIFEMHIAKNKFSSYKGRQYYKFISDQARFEESDAEETRRYNQMMKG